MPKHFTNYLFALAEDPQALASFQQDPDAAIQAAGLSPEQAEALKSKDAVRIQDAVAKEYPGAPAGPLMYGVGYPLGGFHSTERGGPIVYSAGSEPAPPHNAAEAPGAAAPGEQDAAPEPVLVPITLTLWLRL